MTRVLERTAGPSGGLHVGKRTVRRWGWRGGETLRSALLRCRRHEWYGVRATLGAAGATEAAVLLRFMSAGVEIRRRWLTLHGPGAAAQRFGWFQTPKDADALVVELHARTAREVSSMDVYHVNERGPKCHPLANVPPWSSYKPPFPPDRVLLPASLAAIAPLLDDSLPVEALERPSSLKHLVAAISGSVAILDPAWVAPLRLELRDLQRLASVAWLLVDLDTFASAIQAAAAAETCVETIRGLCETMGARVGYSDVATRGFALQDVFPWGTVDCAGRFAMRALRTTRSFRRWADEAGVAPLLESIGPSDRQCEQILSAVSAVGAGELIATDLPWLIARHSQTSTGDSMLAAPLLAQHALRMHLCGRIDDVTQHWNRWDETGVMVRDISDLARRYPMLRPTRWASDDGRLVRLGVTLVPRNGMSAGEVGPAAGTPLLHDASARPRRHLMIRSGRIDLLEPHDGAPPEPLMIFIKQLARDYRGGNPWALRSLGDTAVTWQFDSAEGLRYALLYDAADASLPPPIATLMLRVENNQLTFSRGVTGAGRNGSSGPRIAMPSGLFNDGSIESQSRLDAALRQWIDECG